MTRRYDFSRLVDVAAGGALRDAAHPGALSMGELAERLGVSRRNLHRWARNGIPDAAVDRVAIALGHVPYALWPEWATDDQPPPPGDWTAARQRQLEQHRAAMAARAAAARETLRALVYPRRRCETCAGTFEPHHHAQRYCRMSCSEAARRSAIAA